MPVRYGLMWSAAQFVERMGCLSSFGDPIAQGPEARHDGKDHQKYENQPHAIRGQSLGQDAKQDNHLINLLPEALLLAGLMTIINLRLAPGQGRWCRSRGP